MAATIAYPWLTEPAAAAESCAAPAAIAAGDAVECRQAPAAIATGDLVAPVPRVCLSRADAARALGLGLSTLKHLEQAGEAPPYFDAPGGRRLYPVRGLVEWADQRAGGAFGAAAEISGKTGSG